MSNQQQIALFGLGSMGYGMAMSLLRAGHRVHGFDVVAEAMQRFRSDGGQEGSLETVAGQVSTAVVVVLNAAQTESVLFGDSGPAGDADTSGLVAQLSPGACVIACATMAPDAARSFASRCAEHGVHYLDAPISGGAIKAAAGKLSIMASGSDEAFAAAQPALDAMAEKVFNMGSDIGSGSAMKSVNQLLAGVHIACMAEAMTFGMKQGIDPARIVEVITQSAGNSWMFENRAPHIVDGDYTPHSAVNIWLKDLGIVQDIAKSNQFATPLTATALQQFIAAAGSGLGREDDAAVAKVYARNAGLSLPGDL